jgi:hypothetical protein
MFELMFTTDNAAFGDDQFSRGAEIARILRAIADKIDKETMTRGTARDANGNKVGEWEIRS